MCFFYKMSVNDSCSIFASDINERKSQSISATAVFLYRPIL